MKITFDCYLNVSPPDDDGDNDDEDDDNSDGDCDDAMERTSDLESEDEEEEETKEEKKKTKKKVSFNTTVEELGGEKALPAMNPEQFKAMLLVSAAYTCHMSLLYNSHDNIWCH